MTLFDILMTVIGEMLIGLGLVIMLAVVICWVSGRTAVSTREDFRDPF